MTLLAAVLELEDRADSKSAVPKGREGSTPSRGTNWVVGCRLRLKSQKENNPLTPFAKGELKTNYALRQNHQKFITRNSASGPTFYLAGDL